MKAAVEEAIEELESGLPEAAVETQEDDDGGAYVIVADQELGSSFHPQRSWIGFHIVWSYPDADVYPHFIDPEVRYVGDREKPNDGLPTALSKGATMPGFERPAIQVSRRSNGRDAATDSALQKLLRVLDFLQER